MRGVRSKTRPPRGQNELLSLGDVFIPSAKVRATWPGLTGGTAKLRRPLDLYSHRHRIIREPQVTWGTSSVQVWLLKGDSE